MKRFAAMALVLLVTASAYYGCRTRTEEDMAQAFERNTERAAERIGDALDLSAEQQEVLASIRKEIAAKRSEVLALRKSVVSDLHAAVKKGEFQEDEVNTLMEGHEQSVKELRKFAVHQFARFHQSLNPEQKEKLNTMMEQFVSHRW